MQMYHLFSSEITHRRPVGVVCPDRYFRAVDNRYFDEDRDKRCCAHQYSYRLQEHYHQLYFYHWSFYLDKFFTLNLTFHHVYFSSTNINECYFANLTVNDCAKTKSIVLEWDERVDWRSPKWTHREIKHGIVTSVYNFTFCGIHSKATIFSRCSNVAVVTQLQHYILHDTKLSYSVIDFRKIVSTSLGRKTETNTQLFNQIWDLESKKYVLLETMRVSAPKYETILLTVSVAENIHVEVYDGPGILSPLLGFSTQVAGNTTSILFKTTTFQCLVFKYKFNALMKFVTVPSRVEIKTTDTHFPHTTIFPSHRLCQSSQLCLLRFRTDPGFKVNLSVADLQYNGQHNTATCLFGGLSVYDKKTEISTVCPCPHHTLETSVFEAELYQNVYTSTNTALLVLYSSAEYGNLSAIVVVTNTKCKTISLNACGIKPTRIVFDYFFTQIGDVIENVQDSDCLILQLSYTVTRIAAPLHRPWWAAHAKFFYQSNPLEKCQLDVHPTSQVALGRKISLQVTGFLRGKSSGVANIAATCGEQNHLPFRNHPHIFALQNSLFFFLKQTQVSLTTS